MIVPVKSGILTVLSAVGSTACNLVSFVSTVEPSNLIWFFNSKGIALIITKLSPETASFDLITGIPEPSLSICNIVPSPIIWSSSTVILPKKLTLSFTIRVVESVERIVLPAISIVPNAVSYTHLTLPTICSV